MSIIFLCLLYCAFSLSGFIHHNLGGERTGGGNAGTEPTDGVCAPEGIGTRTASVGVVEKVYRVGKVESVEHPRLRALRSQSRLRLRTGTALSRSPQRSLVRFTQMISVVKILLCRRY